MDLKDLMQFAPKEVRDESVLTAQKAVYAPMAKELNKKVEEAVSRETQYTQQPCGTWQGLRPESC